MRRGVLGVASRDLNAELARDLKVDADAGAVISEVQRGSEAERAGLRAGDVVVAINDMPVRRAADLSNRLGLLPVGEQVHLEIVRGSRRLRVDTRIGERGSRHIGAAVIEQWLAGASFATADPSAAEGVTVQRVSQGSAAWRAGLRPGDVIVAANGKAVQRLSDLEYAAALGNGLLQLRIMRGHLTMLILLG